jgi:hypothetical protein
MPVSIIYALQALISRLEDAAQQLNRALPATGNPKPDLGTKDDGAVRKALHVAPIRLRR